MAYATDWIARTLTIPVSDLVLVSGTRYRLLMSDFLEECRRLEWEFVDGLWSVPILDHTNAKLDFAGADYAGFDELINNFTVTFSAPAERVDLVGSNNNIVDVLNVNGISIVPSNSAGLQRVTTGTSGLTTEESTAFLSMETKLAYHTKIINNKKELLKETDIWYLVVYDDDNVTEIMRKEQRDVDGNVVSDIVAGLLAQELKTSV